jgi:hypothetical protein
LAAGRSSSLSWVLRRDRAVASRAWHLCRLASRPRRAGVSGVTVLARVPDIS